MTEGGLVFDATDAPIVLASDLLNVDHYERHGADWALIERLPIDQDVDARTMRRDEGGCLYALGAASTGVSGAEPTKLLQRDSAWHVTPLGTGVQGRSSALALSPSGEPQVVWSEIIVGASYRLYWARGAASEELAWAGGSYEARGLDVSIGVSAAPAGREIPHVLFRAADAAGADELRYATRASDGTWSFTLLGSGRARGCSGPPTASGDSCTVDGLYFVPLTVVASGSGDVRLFWAQIAETGTLTGRCGAPGPVDCVWDESTTRDARLVVGTPGEPPAEVGTGLDLANATAALDSTGRIHIAASDLAAGLRYLLVGPATP